MIEHEGTVEVNFEDDQLLIYTVTTTEMKFKDRQFKAKLTIGTSFFGSMHYTEYRRFLAGGSKAGKAIIDYQDEQVIVFTITLDDGRTFRRHEDKRRLEFIELEQPLVVKGDPLAIRSMERFRKSGPAYR